MKKILLIALCLSLASCDKLGAGAGIQRIMGNWVQVHLPDGCVAKSIAADEHGGVAVLCEDGRVFH